jgi:hypothetical protein
MKKRKYNPACVEDEVSISDMLSKELDMISGDEMNLENEGQSASEESSNTLPESECVRVIQVLHVLMGGKTLQWVTSNSNAYTFTKNAGPQFHLLPDAEPMNYCSLFFNDELLNNIVVETNRYARQNFGTSA